MTTTARAARGLFCRAVGHLSAPVTGAVSGRRRYAEYGNHSRYSHTVDDKLICWVSWNKIYTI